MEAKEKKPFHEVVAEGLIKQLEAGTAPWQRPWAAGQAPGAFMPMNPTTNKRYRGINALHLMSQGYQDQRWLTYKQAAGMGAQVMKGQRGTSIQYWKFSDEETVVRDGETVKVSVQLERPRVFFATVFNAEQIEGMPPIQPKQPNEQTWTAIERAEKIIAASGADITHSEGGNAFYRPSTDRVHMPAREQFPTADAYYATGLHELGHWTGHESRLARDLSNPFGSEGYAREELRAEIASMILGDELGIGHDPGQHVAYVASWITALKKDPMEIFRAAADAEKIHVFIMAFEQVQQQGQEQAQDAQQRQEPADPLTVALVSGQHALSMEVSRVDRFTSTEHEGGRIYDRLAHRIMSAQDAVVASAWRDRMVSTPATEASDIEALQLESRAALGGALPGDWSGAVRVDRDAAFGADFFIVNAVGADGVLTPIDDFPTVREAEQLAGRIRLIDAHAQVDENSRTAKLARAQEIAVRLDLHSDDDARSDAKEIRKTAEFNQAGATVTPAVEQAERTYIAVAFKEKNEAKALGAKWDKQEQSWYVPAGIQLDRFAKWMPLAQPALNPPPADPAEQSNAQDANAVSAAQDTPPTPPAAQPRQDPPAAAAAARVYLAVPYDEREPAKQAGARWDTKNKAWYAGPDADLAKLQQWVPQPGRPGQDPAKGPEEEFADQLKSMGFILPEGHPIMDGKRHRVPTEGDKGRERTGMYIGYLDGHPAGYAVDNRSKVEVRWKAKGYTLSDEERANLRAEAAEKLQRREAEQEAIYSATSDRMYSQMDNLSPVTADQPPPYLSAKGIAAHPGAFTDERQLTTFIPAIDAENRIWTMQYIQEDGVKRFAKDSRKEGCFHVVGNGLEALESAPAIVIGEGYATAATLTETLGFATVAAFDSGNLLPVAMALRERFPDKPLVIAGDDDLHLIDNPHVGYNVGRKMAEGAAKEVGGTTMFPIFAPGERDTKSSAFTDFNDLATKSIFGVDGCQRQVQAVVKNAIARHREARLDSTQDQAKNRHIEPRSITSPGSEETQQRRRRSVGV